MLQFVYFSLSEAVTNLWRSRVINLLAIGTIMFAMFILGSFVFVGTNLKRVSLDWQNQIQFNVFLKNEAGKEQTEDVRQILEKQMFVDGIEYLDREAARSRFMGDFSAYRELAGELDQNPFPASFQVRLIEGAEKEAFERVLEDLREHGAVEEVYYDKEVFDQLSFLGNLIHMVGLFFALIMVGASIFTISNVLKLTFFARREEVDIMKLVGASRAYIRGPFIVEGVLQGFLGAAMGVSLVYIGYLLLAYYLGRNQIGFLGALELSFFSAQWTLVIVSSGMFSGLLGSVFSLNQFLEEHIRYQ